VAGGLLSLAALALFLRVWRPAEPWRFAHESAAPPPAAAPAYTRAEVLSAWVPWLLLPLFVFLWGLPAVKAALDRPTTVPVEEPALHLRVARVPPVVPAERAEEAVFK